MEHLPRARGHGFDPLPHAEEFSGGLKEQLFVQQAVIQQRARLVPIPEDHPQVRPLLRAHRSDAHAVLKAVRKKALVEPVAGLAQFRFAAQVIKLKLELCLFMRGLFVGHKRLLAPTIIEEQATYVHRDYRTTIRYYELLFR